MIIPIDLKLLKVTMATTTPTILDQISAEKTKISERLVRLDADRAKIASQLIDLETAERGLARCQIAPPTPRAVGFAEVPMREPRNELERDLFDQLRRARERAQS